MLKDSSALDLLCDRLNRLVEHIDECIDKHGEALVLGDLDAAQAPCDGTCNHHPLTSEAAEDTDRAAAAIEAGKAAALADAEALAKERETASPTANGTQAHTGTV